MKSGFPSPQIVVVHAGKIIVDQRIRMDHLQSASGDQSPAHIHAVAFTDCKEKDWAQTLPGR
jgi:hypothetical protein